MKIIIGAGKNAYKGWISTQENELNLLKRADFEKMFSGETQGSYRKQASRPTQREAEAR